MRKSLVVVGFALALGACAQTPPPGGQTATGDAAVYTSSQATVSVGPAGTSTMPSGSSATVTPAP